MQITGTIQSHAMQGRPDARLVTIAGDDPTGPHVLITTSTLDLELLPIGEQATVTIEVAPAGAA